MEGHHRLGGRRRHLLARTDEPGHTGPPPGIDFEPESGEGLDVGAGGHAGLVHVPPVLAPHHVAGVQGAYLPEHLHLLVPQGVGPVPRRWLHGQQGHDLQEVVLDDVADRARAVVERAPPLDAEVLGHRDLDAGHEVAVPDRLEERVGEPEHEQALDRLLAQVVVDAEDVLLGEGLVEDPVELLGRLEVPAERLLDHDPGVARALGGVEALDDVVEEGRGDGQVVQRPITALGADGFGQTGVGVGLAFFIKCHHHHSSTIGLAGKSLVDKFFFSFFQRN